jgi:hypothetical protein
MPCRHRVGLRRGNLRIGPNRIAVGPGARGKLFLEVALERYGADGAIGGQVAAGPVLATDGPGDEYRYDRRSR